MPAIALRVMAGTSASTSEVVAVNYDDHPVELKTDAFEGRLAIRIKDFHGAAAKGKEVRRSPESDYFEQHPKITWSMQLQGRFLKPVSADEVVFGNLFDKPIRDYLPYGTTAALKAVNWIDPSLEQDVYADKPWAWSPLIATFNVVQLSKTDGKLPVWNGKQPQEDVTAALPEDGEAMKGLPDKRRKYFNNAAHRSQIEFGPNLVVDADFCNGFLNFETLSLKLGAGLEFGLAKYWDGQPVRYICRTRDGSEEFFRIEFTIVDAEIIKEKKAEGKDVAHAEEAFKKDLGDKEAQTSMVDNDALGVD